MVDNQIIDVEQRIKAKLDFINAIPKGYGRREKVLKKMGLKWNVKTQSYIEDSLSEVSMKIEIKINWCSFHNIPMSICNKTSSMSCQQSYLAIESAIWELRYSPNKNKLIKENEVKIEVKE